MTGPRADPCHRGARWPGPGAAGAPRRGERGSATVLVLAAGLVVLVVGLVLALAVAHAAALHRARGVADLAAVAGAAAYARGAACATAVRVAVENGGRATDCRTTGDAIEHAVVVTVEIGVTRPAPGLPGAVRATATAGRVA